MASVSNNTKGNPYHDEKTGEFTSENGGGTKSGETLKIKLKEGTNLDDLKSEIASKPKLKLKVVP